jgi:transporter family-2 protein
MYILLAIANGALAVGSRIVNASLSDRIGDLGGSFVNHAVGWGVAGLLLGLGLGQEGGAWSAAPWWAWSGGVLGVLVVAASNYAVRRAGAALFGVLVVAAQLATSAIIDHLGLFGQTPIAVTPMRVSGLLLLAGAAALIVSDEGTSEKRTSGDGTSDNGASDEGASDKGASDKGASAERASDHGGSPSPDDRRADGSGSGSSDAA